MTSIEKLLIQGIRSFDPKESSVIDFYTPLTLLVGSNGAGKTTVIECLKYICTGEMPPNCANGQAFIHDTKIANETEVKAQIKLRFKNPNGKPIVATRSLSLIQKSSKQEYRQIDSSLQSYNADGQKVSKSFRCSDLDKEIPELMGVAKPILKHVIFCHQEESNWPLSESSKLKVKFDEIFAAVRYTKALKAIKDKKKELTSQIKEYKLKLEVVSSNKDHAHRIQNDLKRMETQLTRDNESLERIKQDLVDRKREMEKTQTLQEKVQGLVNEVSVLEARLKEMDRIRQQYLSTLPEVMEETDEELIAMNNSFDDELKTMKDAEQELSVNLSRLSLRKLEVQKNFSQCQQELVRLQVVSEQYNQTIQERDKEIMEFINRYKMKGYENLGSPLSKETVEKFLKEITDKFKLLENALNDSAIKSPLHRFTQEISEKRLEKQRLEVKLTQEKQQHQQNSNKIKSLDSEISGYFNSSNKSMELEQEIKDIEQEILNLERDIKSSNFQLKINDLQSSKRTHEINLQEQRELYKILSQFQTHITLKSKDSQEKSDKIDLKLTSILSDINEIYRDGWKLENLEKLTQESIRVKSEELNRLDQSNNLIKSDVLKISSEISFIQKQLTNKEKEIEQLSHLDLNTMNLQDLQQEITEKQGKLNLLVKTNAILESEEVVYKEYIAIANQNKECSLCKTEMKSEQDLEKFVNHLTTHTTNIPERLKSIQSEIKDFTSYLKDLNQKKLDLSQLIELNSIISEHQEKISILNVQLKEKQSIDREDSIKIQEIKDKLALYNNIYSQSRVITQLHQEKLKLDQEIKLEQHQISLKLSNSQSSSIEELEGLIESNNTQLQLDSENLDNLTIQSKEKNDLLFGAKNKLMALKNQFSMISNSTGIIERLKESKLELIKENDSFEETYGQLENQIHESQLAVEKLTQDHDQEKIKFDSKMATLQKEKNLFQARIESIKNYHCSRILQSNTNIGETLKKLQQQSQEFQEMIKVIEADYELGDQSISEIRNNLSQVDITKRTINDNIAYRQQLSNLEQLQKQLERKREIIKGFNTQDEIRSINDLKATFDQLKSKYDQITGQTSVLTNQISQSQKELNKPIYNAIDENYKDLFLKLQASELVSGDLEKYFKALDKSLMKYHTLKMDEINKSIRETWQSTYKGNDIDTIEIRAEETKTANKTVNYRVVMIKGDVELDMRGRCSAGQKVLACLVIRIALADNFCSNCGILALDEPTSHLDRSNIESFANALLNIIEVRKNQKGFQLIIITHDEEFVQYLSRGNFCDYYWRVTKNASQHSTLERKPISSINS